MAVMLAWVAAAHGRACYLACQRVAAFADQAARGAGVALVGVAWAGQPSASGLAQPVALQRAPLVPEHPTLPLLLAPRSPLLVQLQALLQQ